MVGTYLPTDTASMLRRDQVATAFGDGLTDHAKAFGAGALQIGANIGDAIDAGNGVSTTLNQWADDIGNTYSPHAQDQLDKYNATIQARQNDGDSYLRAVAEASLQHPLGATLTFTREIAPSLVPLAGVAKVPGALSTLSQRAIPPAMIIGALDGAGEVNRDYFEKTGDTIPPWYLTSGGAVLGSTLHRLWGPVGDGGVTWLKNLTPNELNDILQQQNPNPTAQLWGLE